MILQPTDWAWGLAGGLVIGLAGAVYLLMNGRIMGASGILGGLVDRSGWATWGERMSFIAGLVLVPAVAAALMGGAESHVTDKLWVIIVAGLLVGLGTRLANGCTSGHGVCGISRLSLRGIAATFAYLIAGGVIMVAARHWLGII